MNWFIANLNPPIFQAFLSKELMSELLDFLDFLGWVLSAVAQDISHLHGI
jgi:hypothetical protein